MRSSPRSSTRTTLPTGPEMDVTPDDFGRIAAQTVRQVMSQRIRRSSASSNGEE